MSDWRAWLAVWRLRCCTAHGARVGEVEIRGADQEAVLGDEELIYALAASGWERYGMFAGQPFLRAVVQWSDKRRLLISGTRPGERSEEIAR